MLIEI